MATKKVQIGDKYGKLTVVERAEPYVSPQGKKTSQFKCVCDCGKTITVRGVYLLSGHTKSCGCAHHSAVALKIKDLTGQRFGHLVVTEYKGNSLWEAVCDCGKVRTYNGRYLRAGETKSCGCRIGEPMTGKRFGRLTVLEEAGLHRTPDGTTYRQYKCICECGKTLITLGVSLRSGDTKSCGCLVAETSKTLNTKHGKSFTRLYTMWASMKQRCYYEKADNYANYGGRGIEVCEEWRNDFQAFYDWAMANGYNPNAPKCGCTIDRINSNGNYEPSNCRWVGMVTQGNNRTNNHLISYNGEQLTVMEASRKYSISPTALYQRIKNGWSTERALTTPVKTRTI